MKAEKAASTVKLHYPQSSQVKPITVGT